MFDQRLKNNEILAPYTTFKIGGPADYFFVATNVEDVQKAILWAKEKNIPFFIISGGSNLLISDNGFRGLVIKIELNKLDVDGPRIIAESGAKLADIVQATIEFGLTGLIWASGIPGGFGGAIRGNAGAYGGEIKDSIESVIVLREGKIVTLNRKDINFSYRDSGFKHNGDVIISATLLLNEGGDPETLNEESLDIIEERNKKHPHEPSAGSFFKNILITEENRGKFQELEIPEQFWKYGKVATGWLLDQLNFRGRRVGGAVIYDKHANIIMNDGTATAKDVYELSEQMRLAVKEKFGLDIEREVQILGEIV